MSTWDELKNDQRRRENYQTRITIVKLIREFFWSRGFQETETLSAVKYPGQEPYLNPVPLVFHSPTGEPVQRYLHTSPELAMKKLLAAGFSKIFQICKCFRDYESFGGQHYPEFTMLEWYRAPGSYQAVRQDTEELFKYVGQALGKRALEFKGATVSLVAPWEQKTMKELWQQQIGVNLDDYLENVSLRTLARKKNYSVTADDSYSDLFFKIFLNEIEPQLGFQRPVFVFDYPLSMCSLSRPSPKDPRYGERFELYVAGLEIANAFGELTDATEQLRRLENDRAQRQELGRMNWPVDPEFIQALRSGIGGSLAVAGDSRSAQAGGIALGVDRMVMLFCGAPDIKEVIFE